MLTPLDALQAQPYLDEPWNDAYLARLAQSWPDNTVENVVKPFAQWCPSSGPIRILQLGDSHVQAGFSTQALRTYMASQLGLQQLPLGYIFPYGGLKSHDAVGVRTYPSAAWVGVQSLRLKQYTAYGLPCAYLENRDVARPLFVRLTGDNLDSGARGIRVLFEPGTDYCPMLNNREPELLDSAGGYALFQFEEPQKQLELKLAGGAPGSKPFRLWGFLREDESDPLQIFCAGLNGADYEAYCRNLALEHQLKLIAPHIVIISLGTNDAYNLGFDPTVFTNRAHALIQTVKQATPDALIIMCTPNDHLYRKKTPNERVELLCDLLRNITLEEGVALWDFNRIMGGSGSIFSWNNNRLTAADFLHFSALGYRLQAHLMGEALLKLLSPQLPRKTSPTLP